MAKQGKPNTCNLCRWIQYLQLVSLAASSPVNVSTLHNTHVSYVFLISGVFYFWDFFQLEGWVRVQRDDESTYLLLHQDFSVLCWGGAFFHRPYLKSTSIWLVRSWEEVDYILLFLPQEKQNCNKVSTTCATIKEQDSQAVLETLTGDLMSTNLLERKKLN